MLTGPAQLSLQELEPALGFCNYLIYGYAGIDAESFKIKSLNPELSYNRQHYSQITALRRKHPHLRILLSVGGGRDVNAEGVADSVKYLSLLEQPEHRNSFKASVREELSNYGFDGLDLAWQFPLLKPKRQQGALKRAWTSFKGWFSSNSIDPKAEEHKAQFASFVRELRLELQRNGKLLTLSMLPHVDAERKYQMEYHLKTLLILCCSLRRCTIGAQLCGLCQFGHLRFPDPATGSQASGSAGSAV